MVISTLWEVLGQCLLHMPEVLRRIARCSDAPILAYRISETPTNFHEQNNLSSKTKKQLKLGRKNPNCRKWSIQMDPNKVLASGLKINPCKPGCNFESWVKISTSCKCVFSQPSASDRSHILCLPKEAHADAARQAVGFNKCKSCHETTLYPGTLQLRQYHRWFPQLQTPWKVFKHITCMYIFPQVEMQAYSTTGQSSACGQQPHDIWSAPHPCQSGPAKWMTHSPVSN